MTSDINNPLISHCLLFTMALKGKSINIGKCYWKNTWVPILWNNIYIYISGRTINRYLSCLAISCPEIWSVIFMSVIFNIYIMCHKKASTFLFSKYIDQNSSILIIFGVQHPDKICHISSWPPLLEGVVALPCETWRTVSRTLQLLIHVKMHSFKCFY